MAEMKATNLKIDSLSILQQMGIPVWQQKKALPLKIIKEGVRVPRYLLIVGPHSWDVEPSLQTAKLTLLENLTKALHYSFQDCILAEVEEGTDPTLLISSISDLGIQRIIVFGKDLGHFFCLENTATSRIVTIGTGSAAILPTLEALLQDPLQKKEAWACLSTKK